MDELRTTDRKARPISAAKDGHPGRSKWSHPITIAVGTVIIGVLAYWAIAAFAHHRTHEATDDAFLEAHVVFIAPKVAGTVARVFVQENQVVHKGDPLVELDARDFEAKAAQRRAGLKSAESNRKTYETSFELIRTRVLTAQATANQTKAEAEASAAAAERANSDLRRYQELRDKNIISPQEFDQARSTADAANANLVAARQKAAADASRVTEAEVQAEAARTLLQTAVAQTEQSRAELEAAELDVSYTKLFAPADGKIARKAVEPGSYLQVGQRLFALVENELWVVANFKETQLRRMRPGQPVTIEIDAFPKRTYRGRLDSFQAGSGARFSLLPAENAVGNFVKVVQRIPVKIVFDEPLPKDLPVGPGMSVVPSVQVSAREISPALVVVAAVIVALVAGAAWWFLGRRKQEPE